MKNKLSLFKFFIPFLLLLFFVEIYSRLHGVQYLKKHVPQPKGNYLFIENRLNHTPLYKHSKYPGKYPHPYFGYYESGSGEPLLNRERNLFKKGDDSIFRIGVFGGSVAESFYLFNNQHKILQKKISEWFESSKKVELVNFATGGYKQPQAFSIASILQPDIQFSINIEGSNELSYVSNPITYPHFSVSQLYFSGLEKSIIYNDGLRLLNKKNRLHKALQQHFSFKFIELITYIEVHWTIRKIFKLNEKLKISFLEKKNQVNLSTNDSERVKFWLDLSCKQQNMMTLSYTPSMYFMQPVPYLPKSKPLTLDEQKMVDKFAMKNNIKKLAIDFVKAREIASKMHGFEFVNLTNIFKQTTDRTYIDGCCHLNSEGNKILTSQIGKHILKYLNRKKKLRICQSNFR